MLERNEFVIHSFKQSYGPFVFLFLYTYYRKPCVLHIYTHRKLSSKFQIVKMIINSMQMCIKKGNLFNQFFAELRPLCVGILALPSGALLGFDFVDGNDSFKS